MTTNDSKNKPKIARKVLSFNKGDTVGGDGMINVQSAIMDFCEHWDDLTGESVSGIDADESSLHAAVDFEVIIRMKRSDKYERKE